MRAHRGQGSFKAKVLNAKILSAAASNATLSLPGAVELWSDAPSWRSAALIVGARSESGALQGTLISVIDFDGSK
jgi:hypothetical protein